MIKPLMESLHAHAIKEYRIAQTVHSDGPVEEVNLLAMFGFPAEAVKQCYVSLKFGNMEYINVL